METFPIIWEPCLFSNLMSWRSWHPDEVLVTYVELRGSPYLLFWRETILRLFPWVLVWVYNSWKKNYMLPTFQNGHFVRVCTEKMMDHKYEESDARNIYSNYNQMRAYVECSPNQSKTIIPYRPFHRAIDETLKVPEKCWPFLCLNFTRVLQFSSANPRLSDGYRYCMCTNRQLFL